MAPGEDAARAEADRRKSSHHRRPAQVYGPGGLGYITIYSMLHNFREQRSSKGKRQWNFSMGGPEPFMMLPADMALDWDESYRAHVHFYNRDRLAFRYDARDNFKKLCELGCEGLVAEEPCAPAKDRYL